MALWYDPTDTVVYSEALLLCHTHTRSHVVCTVSTKMIPSLHFQIKAGLGHLLLNCHHICWEETKIFKNICSSKPDWQLQVKRVWWAARTQTSWGVWLWGIAMQIDLSSLDIRNIWMSFWISPYTDIKSKASKECMGMFWYVSMCISKKSDTAFSCSLRNVRFCWTTFTWGYFTEHFNTP